MRSLAFICAVFLALPGLAAEADVSSLSYEQVKQMFEKDEKLEGVRISSFTASSVTVIYKGRYLNFDRAKLSPAQQVQIDALIARTKEQNQEQAAKENDEAARRGMLREVDGVVYNLMRPTADWKQFDRVKVLQKTEDGLLVDIAESRDDLVLVFVRNLPQFANVADGDTISFLARQTGTYTYMTRAKVDKTVRQYDCGTAPGKWKKPGLVRAPGEKPAALDGSWASSGTGFFITADGYLATCHHVVDDGKVFSVRTPGGKFPARVVASDETNDVAILKVAGTFKPLAINTNALRLGQPAFTIGFPNIDIQGLAPKYTDGKVSSLSGIRDDTSAFQISVPVQPGNSGGPLTDAGGNIIGVVVARLSDYSVLRRTRSLPQNVNYAVKTGPLVRLIRRLGIEQKVRFSAATDANDPVKAVEDATALILVSQ
jgi:S1-C subfamily serine protease